MKKVLFVMAMVLLGGASFAASIAVPWFYDELETDVGYPLAKNTSVGYVYLKSNADVTLVCTIGYYNGDGDFLGPFAPLNTFTIAPKSALAFRPCANDPSLAAGGTAGGQEGGQGVLVPNRPRSVDTVTPIPGTNVVDRRRNGSITIEWEAPAGTPADKGKSLIQGSYVGVGRQDNVVVSYGHLLPSGV
ncbi:MAG: hypothetical protein H3C30_09110 [Candidatus Hydrogenedentes bacterium]|nr:hypothetical protein [Candidatus Hydrogenedentota bacterium]